MKIRHFWRRKFILVLATGAIICWTAAGNCFEQWEATASARVNLRESPGLSGEILDILPYGHKVRIVKVRIIEEKGRWCKVDVKGEVNGTGWVYAQYLERIPPKVLQTESSAQTVKMEIESEEQKQGTPPVVPVSIPPAQSSYVVVKPDAPQISGKDHSELTGQKDSTTHQKSIPGEKDKHGGAAQGVPPTVGDQPEPDDHVIASALTKLTVSHEINGLIVKKRSLKPVTVALKLLSIVLYGLVVLLLYKRD
jgi:uncharacterized protein YraI